MTQLQVFVAEDFELPPGSGLGFYGDLGFGDPVARPAFQGRTFVTDPTGGWEGFECNNCKLLATASWSGVNGVSGVVVGQMGNGIYLRRLPNYLATMNLRLTTEAPVRAQNAVLYVHDGVSKGNPPLGLLAYGAEIRHPSRLQTDLGDGDWAWRFLAGSSHSLGLVDAPGTSGLRPDGALTISDRHDWYVALSASPATPGTKQFGFTFECEFL